jgi:hypothetical protein
MERNVACKDEISKLIITDTKQQQRSVRLFVICLSLSDKEHFRVHALQETFPILGGSFMVQESDGDKKKLINASITDTT